MWHCYVATVFAACLTNLYEYCGSTHLYLLTVPLCFSLWFLEYEGLCCCLWRHAIMEYIAWKTWLHVHAQLDCWSQPCSVCLTCSAMRDQVYSRDQLLGLWLQAKYSFANVTRCQVWSVGLGHEKSRPRGRCSCHPSISCLLNSLRNRRRSPPSPPPLRFHAAADNLMGSAV